MGAALSVREASRFIIGAAVLKQAAMAQSGSAVTLSDIAKLVTAGNAEVATPIRSSIERSANIADNEGYFRNSPSHVGCTEKVLESRQDEINGYAAIYDSIFEASRYDLSKALSKDSPHYNDLLSHTIDAHLRIDAMPGRADNKEAALALFYADMNTLAGDELAPQMNEFLATADLAAIDMQRDQVFSEIAPLDDYVEPQFDDDELSL